MISNTNYFTFSDLLLYLMQLNGFLRSYHDKFIDRADTEQSRNFNRKHTRPSGDGRGRRVQGKITLYSVLP